jgi:hypothetical protein
VSIKWNNLRDKKVIAFIAFAIIATLVSSLVVKRMVEHDMDVRITQISNAQQFEPLDFYEEEANRLQVCLAVTAPKLKVETPYSVIRWFKMEVIPYDDHFDIMVEYDKHIVGYAFIRDNAILIEDIYVYDRTLIRHELVHAMYHVWGHPSYAFNQTCGTKLP